MRFKSYIPALYVLTTQLDSLSKPSRPHKIMNFFFATLSPELVEGSLGGRFLHTCQVLKTLQVFRPGFLLYPR